MEPPPSFPMARGPIPRSHLGGSSSGRAPGAPLQIPGIAAGAEDGVIGRKLTAEFRGIGLSDDGTAAARNRSTSTASTSGMFFSR